MDLYPDMLSRVMLVMLDGVRPDAIAVSKAPVLDGLIERGSYTDSGSSVMPSITLPCHTSIFHSVPPERHGITSNTWTPMARPVPGLLDLAAHAGKRCAFFYNWEPLRDIARPGALDLSYFTRTAVHPDGDDGLAREAAARIPVEGWDFVFLYFGTIDEAGHRHGWMSPEYLAQLERVDGLLGRVLEAIPDDYTVVIQADHGGHARSHGTDCPEDMTIPWLAAGPPVKRGHKISSPVSLLDTAPTIASLLGLTAPPLWEGKIVEEIFSDRSPLI